jgi:hypothetical protein
VGGGCCAKQEQFKYFSVRNEYVDFNVTARLDGTYYQDRKGNVDRPYTLFVSVHPKVAGEFTISKVLLRSESESLVLDNPYPAVGMDVGVDSKRFYFIKISGLDIGYEEYRVEFEVFRDGSFVEKVECFFKKDYSSRYTTRWLEAINSI